MTDRYETATVPANDDPLAVIQWVVDYLTDTQVYTGSIDSADTEVIRDELTRFLARTRQSDEQPTWNDVTEAEHQAATQAQGELPRGRDDDD